MGFEHRSRDDGRRERPREGRRLLVDEEHAIGVAVEGESYVCAGFHDPTLQVDEVLGLDGVSRMIREVAIELAEEDLDLERQAAEHRWRNEHAHAVCGVGDDLERPKAGDVHERVHMPSELVQQVDAFESGIGRRKLRSVVRGKARQDRFSPLADLFETCVLTDRACTWKAHLYAVVTRRIVRGREHRPRQSEAPGREVEHVCRDHPSVDDT